MSTLKQKVDYFAIFSRGGNIDVMLGRKLKCSACLGAGIYTFHIIAQKIFCKTARDPCHVFFLHVDQNINPSMQYQSFALKIEVNRQI